MVQVDKLVVIFPFLDAIFVAGSGDEDAAGFQLPTEKEGKEPLRKYKRETLRLSIPKESSDSVQYVGVWSPSVGMISSVTFPSEGLLPPAPENLR